MAYHHSSHHSYLSKAILHVDADAFFASCEQAVNPAYKGKPVITGKERGIVAAASYEAKALGIKRGVTLRDVKKICPDAIILPSNYETYSLFSKRMFEIIRRTTSMVEEYSIDEAFADITGLRRPLGMSYNQIAARVKNQIETELGISVSVGLASTKTLGKIAANWNKPSGLVTITQRDIDYYLEKTKVEDIWGIGQQTTQYLRKFNIRTGLDLAQRDFAWIERHFTKPHQALWREINGESVYSVENEIKDNYLSISKTRTFSPASRDRSFVFAQLSKNIENAFIKVRRHHLTTKRIVVYLKTQQFMSQGIDAKLNRATGFPNEVLPLVRKLFDQIFLTNTDYRASGVILSDLQTDNSIQMNLFEKPVQIDKLQHIYESIDQLSKKYGKHTVFLGSSMPAQTISQHQNYRGAVPEAKQKRDKQIHQRKFMNLPLLLGKVN